MTLDAHYINTTSRGKFGTHKAIWNPQIKSLGLVIAVPLLLSSRGLVKFCGRGVVVVTLLSRGIGYRKFTSLSSWLSDAMRGRVKHTDTDGVFVILGHQDLFV